jgi:hypothetical protein
VVVAYRELSGSNRARAAISFPCSLSNVKSYRYAVAQPNANTHPIVLTNNRRMSGRSDSKAKESEMVEKKDISLEELLAEQSKSVILATIEAVADKTEFVKVTPWIVGRGCMCHFALEVPKKDIANVVLTTHGRSCCGKDLSVVQVEFKPSSVLPTASAFAAISRLASDFEHRRIPPARHLTGRAGGTSLSSAARGGRAGDPTIPDNIIVEIFHTVSSFVGCCWRYSEFGPLTPEQIRDCWAYATGGGD